MTLAESVLSRHLSEARVVTHGVARTFSLAMRFLPSPIRRDVYLLYLVCRSLDDLVDMGRPEAAARLGQVRGWADGHGAIVGREEEILSYLLSRHPEMRRDAVVDFCDGQLQDLSQSRIGTESELDEHAYHVAGTVGVLMAGLLGVRANSDYEAAAALGVAMQRTNILRDIDEDLGRGRIYVPSTTLAKAGIADLDRDDRGEMLKFEIKIADGWYEKGLAGTRQLLHGGWQVRAAALMYREILRQLERRDAADSRTRVRVGGCRKALLVGRAVLRG